MPHAEQPWHILADTGGTFTDAIAVDPHGVTRRAKVLSVGAVRGVVRIVDDNALHAASPIQCSRALLGMRLIVRHPDGSTFDQLIRRVDDLGATYGFDTPPPKHLAGCTFELRSDEEAPVFAARLLTGTPPGAPFPAMRMRIATTKGTNALLTRSGAPAALFITRGFADLLEIGTQQRPRLFDLDIRRPSPLAHVVVEVDERIDANGSILTPLDLSSIESHARSLVARGVRSAAVALMHSDRFQQHEQELIGALRAFGFTSISASSELAPFIKLLPRAQTAVTDAYLAPIVHAYIDRIRDAIDASPAEASHAPPRSTLHVLTSSGGLSVAHAFRAKDSLLSGPAGGVVGAALAAKRSGFSRVLTFDMGGTSTDVVRLDPEPSIVHEHAVGDARLVSPAVGVETVAAGGGSICGFDGVALRVGPASAGADPGPACYGFNGPLTLTDVNLLLGRVDPTRFPIPITIHAASDAANRVLEKLRDAGISMTRESMLAGFLELATERIAGVIRRVSSRIGYDPIDHALLAFGGAGGQHACAVAKRLGCQTVLIPRDAGLLSAAGLAGASVQRLAERQILRPLESLRWTLREISNELDITALRQVEQDLGEDAGSENARASVVRRTAALRLDGQESFLEIEMRDDTLSENAAQTLTLLFAARYHAVYGHAPERRPLQLVWLRSIAAGGSLSSIVSPGEEHSTVIRVDRSRASAAVRRTQRAWFADRWIDAPVYERDELPIGASVAGPSLIVEQHACTAVDFGWQAKIDDAGAIVLVQGELSASPQSTNAAQLAGADTTAAPPNDLLATELFSSRIESIALEMGEILRRTAVSTNVKERLDFSCAILDEHAELIVNAPHVPVHLGSLGLCVRAVRDAVEMRQGDVIVTNHPAFGGSHLPDITLITPCFASSGKLLGYAASRAHHAEIGGVIPGSMPPFAKSLVEEGVVIAPMHLVEQGVPRYDRLAELLRSAPYPSRALSDNLADLRAAAAANQGGVASLSSLAREFGEDAVPALFERIKARGAAAISSALRTLPRGTHHAEELLDDNSRICVALTLDEARLTIDFAGTSLTHPGNLNATPAIVRSAIVYVLRTLVRDEIPLNEGLMRVCDIRLPVCMLNPVFPSDPRLAPAVAAGNVETSQRLVDTLLKALGVCACSQGTMNNIIFGSSALGLSFYETVCGGAGAGPAFDGASGVHTHMTNTRITDPEILETRYPVRLERFALRRGSGGAGLRRGGDGVIREITFLADMSLAVVTQHRTAGPYGVAGGNAGQPGAQRVIRAGGEVQPLAPIDGTTMHPGDRLILETPGGGGYADEARSHEH